MSTVVEDLQAIENYHDYLEEMKEEFSTQIENCLQSYSGINNTINDLNRDHPEVDKTVFSDFFKILETFFSVFSNTNDILSNFSLLNEQTQKNEQFYGLKMDELHSLKVENQVLIQDNSNKDYMVKKYEEDLSALKKEYNTLYNSTDRTREATEKTQKFTEEEFNTVLKKNQDLRDSNKELENKITELNNTINYLETVNANIAKDYDKRQRSINQETMKNEEKYVLKINRLQNELNKTEKDYHKALEDLENTKKQVEFLKEETIKKKNSGKGTRSPRSPESSLLLLTQKCGNNLNDLMGSENGSFRINLVEMKDESIRINTENSNKEMQTSAIEKEYSIDNEQSLEKFGREDSLIENSYKNKYSTNSSKKEINISKIDEEDENSLEKQMKKEKSNPSTPIKTNISVISNKTISSKKSKKSNSSSNSKKSNSNANLNSNSKKDSSGDKEEEDDNSLEFSMDTVDYKNENEISKMSKISKITKVNHQKNQNSESTLNLCMKIDTNKILETTENEIKQENTNLNHEQESILSINTPKKENKLASKDAENPIKNQNNFNEQENEIELNNNTLNTNNSISLQTSILNTNNHIIEEDQKMPKINSGRNPIFRNNNSSSARLNTRIQRAPLFNNANQGTRHIIDPNTPFSISAINPNLQNVVNNTARLLESTRKSNNNTFTISKESSRLISLRRMQHNSFIRNSLRFPHTSLKDKILLASDKKIKEKESFGSEEEELDNNEFSSGYCESFNPINDNSDLGLVLPNDLMSSNNNKMSYSKLKGKSQNKEFKLDLGKNNKFIKQNHNFDLLENNNTNLQGTPENDPLKHRFQNESLFSWKSRRSYTKGPNKRNDYKQFFILLFRSMILNTDNIEPFLKINPDQLYEECKKDKIPYNKYENFIKKAVEMQIKPKPKEKTDQYKNLIGFISSNLV